MSIRLVPQAQARPWTRLLRQLPDSPPGAIPHVYRLEYWRDFLCALGEPLAGGSLAQRLSQARPVASRRASILAWQVAAVLAWSHDRGLAHGNLCPLTVWITSEGYVKLVDWGIHEGSRDEDCQAYLHLCELLGLEHVPSTSMAETVTWFERRYRRRFVYEPLS